MGKVDTVIRFGRYNSYQLDAGEELWSSKFEVDLYSHIAIQSQVIAAATATGQFIVQWLLADGGKLSTVTENFDIGTRWGRKTWILEVPATAKHTMWAIKNTHGSEPINFACGMAEPGEIAGAFDPSLANAVSYMDAHGFYGGLVVANQVRTGILEGLKGLGGFDLDTPRLWMKSADGAVTWEATPENPLAVKDSLNNLIAGIVKIAEKYGLVTQFIGNTNDLANYGEIGLVSGYGRGLILTSSNKKIGLVHGGDTTLADGTVYNGVALTVNGQQVMSINHYEGSIDCDGGYGWYSPLWWSAEGQIDIGGISTYGNGHAGSASTSFRAHNQADILIELHEDEAYIISPNRNHWLGVDNTGPYYTSGAGKVYLHPQTIAGAQNFNNYTTAGTWYFTGSGHTNGPNTTAGFLRVTGISGAFILQEYFSGTNMYTRRYTSSWNAWTAR